MNNPLSSQGRIERTRLSDTVYEKLLEGILSGRLAPGTIVSEVALAKQLEVSRTPVHDALRQLAKDGLLVQRAGRRAVITAFTRDDVNDIFEMRKILEGEAARRAATRLDKATLASLRATAEELKNKPDGAEFLARWANYNDLFHDSIAKAAGSVRLWHDIIRYRMLHRGFNMLKTTNGNLEIALAEHLEILSALEKGDGDTACRLMQQHIQRWQAHFVNQIPVRQ